MDTKLKQLLKTMKLNESMLSMLFGVVTVILIGVLVLRMYRANKPTITSQAEQTTQPAASEKVGEVPVVTRADGKQYTAQLPETVTVAKGDHLWGIAEKNYGSGYNWVDIAKENGLKNPGILTVGQVLKLPKVSVKVLAQAKVTTSTELPKIEGGSYTVVKGDSLWTIAVRAYADGYKWSEVAKFNNLTSPGRIEVGQVIKLPR
jgi:nucleoid-associated protein YgaU